ncbi:10643_t:CDS:2, partial [Funneliformis geosporum]
PNRPRPISGVHFVNLSSSSWIIGESFSVLEAYQIDLDSEH